MNVLTKLVSFLAVFCVFDASYGAVRAGGSNRTGAATGRVSVTGAVAPAALRRVPTMSVNRSTAASSTSASDSGSLMDSAECIDAYSECIKDSDVCGSDFEECTNNELFYAKKPHCNSVLLQCSSAGIYNLFGASNVSDLSGENVELYPTPGSILGQYIKAGEISNRLDTSACVKKYTSCLNKDNVCGADFELCTDDKEFKKQKIYCEPTLARCQDEGKKELFGTTDTTANPAKGSRVKNMIESGADSAAANAVSTCYKVADQCILNACRTNPFWCIEDTNTYLATIVDGINEGRDIVTPQEDEMSGSTQINRAEVTKRMRNACFDTIGGNKFCHMTKKGAMPSAKDLRDEDERDEVFSDIYASRKNSVVEKLADLRNKFDKNAKDKCVETISSCAVRTCAGGVGAACYTSVFKSGGSTHSINGTNTYDEIQYGCAAIVNADANCQYAAAATANSAYNYAYYDTDTFGKLFPVSSANSDPIGVVAKLNASLAENYNDAALAQMAKQCKTAAESCIRSMCGTDFANCYRNRTDITSDTYATNNRKFDNSMNKVSGILDFTIIRGLCAATVKNSSACEQHLKIQAAKANISKKRAITTPIVKPGANASATTTNLK